MEYYCFVTNCGGLRVQNQVTPSSKCADDIPVTLVIAKIAVC